MKKTIQVGNEQAGIRLDLLLTLNIAGVTRSRVRKILDSGRVVCNGSVEYRPNYKVKINDKFEVNLVVSDFKIVPKSVSAEKMDLDIIYEDDDLIAVNKPAGIQVHQSDSQNTNTLINGLLYYYKNFKNVGDQSVRFGLINRIDKDTSGLVLIGKTNKGLWHYSKCFAQRQVKKTYIAVVVGDISVKAEKNQEIIINNYLMRNPKDRKKYSVSYSPSLGRPALTKIKICKVLEKKTGKYSIIKAFPVTGRTHQIRVHLSCLGYPVLGDKIYGKGNRYKRLMLHAYNIEIPGINGKVLNLCAPPGIEYKEFYAPIYKCL